MTESVSHYCSEDTRPEMEREKARCFPKNIGFSPRVIITAVKGFLPDSTPVGSELISSDGSRRNVTRNKSLRQGPSVRAVGACIAITTDCPVGVCRPQGILSPQSNFYFPPTMRCNMAAGKASLGHSRRVCSPAGVLV